MANQRNAKRKSIAAKMRKDACIHKKDCQGHALYTHHGEENNKSFAGKFSERIQLDDEEIEWLKK